MSPITIAFSIGAVCWLILMALLRNGNKKHTILIAVFALAFMYSTLIGLGLMRSKMYAPEVAACEQRGGSFYCQHGMCHCHEGTKR